MTTSRGRNFRVAADGSNETTARGLEVLETPFLNKGSALNLGIGSAISILIFICVAIIAVLFIKGFGTAAPGTDTGRR